MSTYICIYVYTCISLFLYIYPYLVGEAPEEKTDDDAPPELRHRVENRICGKDTLGKKCVRVLPTCVAPCFRSPRRHFLTFLYRNTPDCTP